MSQYGPGDRPTVVKKRKPRVVRAARTPAPGPPSFPKLVPVRPGAPTPRGATKPSSQAQRTHVHVSRVKRNRQIVRAQAQHDVPTDADLQRAQAFNAAHPTVPTGTRRVGSANVPAALLATDPAVLRAAGFRVEGTAEKIIRLPIAAAGNAPKDLAELAVTTPSSVAKLASTAVHDPGKVPGMLAAPYKQLARDPVGFVTEHPVSTALMLSPAVKLPGRFVGKVARVTGKQSLERPAATLPGSALREARTGSRDVVVRSLQARADKRSGAPRVTDRQIRRRVDEFYGAGQKHVQRVQAAAVKQVRVRKLKGDEAVAHVEGARAGAALQLDRRFAQEFGATAYRTPERVIVKPKGVAPGALHATREDAQVIADKAPFDAVIKPVGDQFAVLPQVAVKRLDHHRGVGTTKALPAKIMRVSRRQFTQTVLPFSPKWLSGQALESAYRSLLAGAGPTSYLRATKVVREMDRQVPGSGQALLERAVPGGLVGRTAAHEMTGKTLADEFAGTALANVAHHVTRMAAKPGPKQVRGLFHAVTGFVFDTLNGRIIEGTTQRAMLGAALKRSPLMERSVLGLSDRAIADAARGLHGTEAQVQLARAVTRSYGKYSSFGPELRSFVQHWTPFLPWYLNVARFLTKTLPVDHPIHAALLADVDAATEEWRKASRLSLHAAHVPSYLLGSAPVGAGDQFVRVGHYTPFGAGEDVSDPTKLVSLLLPQFAGAEAALRGFDWKGQPLNGKFGPDAGPEQKALTAANALIEAMIPGIAQGKSVIKRGPRRTFDPFVSTAKPKSSSGGPSVKVRVPLPLSGPVVPPPPVKLPLR